jgi:rubrerythrin
MGKIPHTPEEQLACSERWSSPRNKLAACCTSAISPITEKLVTLSQIVAREREDPEIDRTSSVTENRGSSCPYVFPFPMKGLDNVLPGNGRKSVMSVRFNADEIFEMAEQIERNGARFYRRAAAGTGDSECQTLLLHLAKMEGRHLKVFADMRADMLKEGQVATVDPVFDPEGEAAAYLRAMADGHVFDVRTDPFEVLSGEETIEEIFRTAIGLEKDSIVFYLGMKEMIPENLGKDKIDHIIKEEMRHITYLNNAIDSVKK